MKYSPALLLCCVSLAGLLRAQNPDKIDQKRGSGDIPDAGVTEEGMADEKVQKLMGADGEVKGKTHPTGRTDLPRFCDFIGSARPSPMPPGTSGTFNVIAVLKGDGVISDASGVKLDYQRQQGPLSLGEPMWPTARPGKLAAAFEGRPVFEDTMVVSIPVTVVAGTPFGKYAVQAQVSANLSQGSNGGALGELKTTVTAVVEVAPATAALDVASRGPEAPSTTNAEAAAHDPKSAAHQSGSGAAPTAAMQARGQALAPEMVNGDDAQDPTSPTSPPRPPEKDGQSMLLMVGGGFLALLLIVLLLAKKR